MVDTTKTISMNIKTSNYTSRVLGVIKEKYGLNDKGQALDKFVEMFGDEFVDREVKEEIIREVIESCDSYIKKHGFKSRTIKDIKKAIEE